MTNCELGTSCKLAPAGGANEIAKLMEEELNKQRNKLQNNCPTK